MIKLMANDVKIGFRFTKYAITIKLVYIYI